MPPTTTPWQRAFYVPLAILAWAAVLVLAGWLLSHVLKALVLLALSGILAFALAPLTRWFARWLPRPLALAVAYALGISIVLGCGAFLVVTLVGQLTALVDNLPYYAEQAAALEPTVVGFLGPLA